MTHMDLKNIFDKKFWLILLAILVVEILSYLGFIWPVINTIGFFVIAAVALVLSIMDIKYGLLLALAELFIGSFGHLFVWEVKGVDISIRMALWLIVLWVWLAQVIVLSFRPKRSEVEKSLQGGTKDTAKGSLGSARDDKGEKEKWYDFFKLPYGKYFYLLFAFVALGLVVGYVNHNNFANIVLDANSWFYLALIFPLAQVFGKGGPHPDPLLTKERENNWQVLVRLLAAAVVWLSVETLAALAFFSHLADWQNLGLYRWLRVTGVGEVTSMSSDFVRVFFQSHIYVLAAVCLLLPLIIKLIINQRGTKDTAKGSLGSARDDKGGVWLAWLLLTIGLTVIIIGQSRSFWLGLAAALVIFNVNYFFSKDPYPTSPLVRGRRKEGVWRVWFKFVGLFAASVIASLLLMTTLVKLPGFGAWNMLSQRSNLNEAAVSSRWALLPKLWQKIGESPIIGKGFGTTVIYKSSDPRVLATHPDGLYETYAFEWGWLDLWLKLSLVGALIYLWFLFILARDAWRLNSPVGVGLVMIITALAVINIFTPYLNHPLGLGVIMLTATYLKNDGVEK